MIRISIIGFSLCLMLWSIYKPSNVDTDLAPGSDLSQLLEKTFGFTKLHHIGRLDRDTSGLLLISCDGFLTNKVLSCTNLPKSYLARVSRPPRPETLINLHDGVVPLGDGPARVIHAEEVFESDVSTSPLFMCPNYQSIEREYFFVRVLTCEGRNRVVRRLLAAVGLPVLALHRERIGNIVLDHSTVPGTVSKVSEDQLEGFLALLDAHS